METSSKPTPQGALKHRVRLDDIERAKGLGILLVVYGHLVVFGTLGEQYWYYITKRSIYLFHMPLFMYLSGFVFFYTNGHEVAGSKYGSYLRKRADRLLIPFLTLGVAIIMGKWVFSQFAYVEEGVTDLWASIYTVVSNGPSNPALSIWFLLVLFVYSIFTPLLWKLLRGNIYFLTLTALALHLISMPEEFYLERIFRYYIFFCIGMISCLHKETILINFRRHIAIYIILFSFAIYVRGGIPFATLICGTLSIPVIHGAMLHWPFNKERFFLWLGQNSMVIYLFNTIAIGIAKVIYLKLLPFNGLWFTVMILVLLFVGIGAPVAFKHIVDRVPRAKFFGNYLR